MPTNTWLCARYARYIDRGGCGRAPDSYHTGTRCSRVIARRAAARSAASSPSVEEMTPAPADPVSRSPPPGPQAIPCPATRSHSAPANPPCPSLSRYRTRQSLGRCVFFHEGAGERLCLGRLIAEPERQVVAAFDPVTLGALDVLVGPHALVELRVGVVRAVNDQGGAGDIAERQRCHPAVLLQVITGAPGPLGVRVHRADHAFHEGQRLGGVQDVIDVAFTLALGEVADLGQRPVEEGARKPFHGEPDKPLAWCAQEEGITDCAPGLGQQVRAADAGDRDQR